MAKIIVPEGTFWKVYRNKMQLSENLMKEENIDKTIMAFSKPENTYIFNIPNTVNSIKELQAGLFWKLGVEGKIEINTGCNINFKIRQSKVAEELKSELSSHWYSNIDYFKCKEITINCINNDYNKSSIHFYYDSSDLKNDNLMKITLNAKNVNFDIGTCNNLKEININSEEINELKFGQNKCIEKINLPNLKLFPIRWCSFDIFNTELDDKCMITLNKDCCVSMEGNTNCEVNELCKEINIKNHKFSSIVNSNTAKTYSETDKTFTVSFNELKLLLKKKMAEEFKKTILNANDKINTKLKDFQNKVINNKEQQKIRG